MVCNADEGDPGAFMDRAVIEGDPHRLVEGMAHRRLRHRRDQGLRLHPRRVSSRHRAAAPRDRSGPELRPARRRTSSAAASSLEIKIKMGAGAFVCGEETALLHSIEGKRGMPRPARRSPPSPASGASRRSSTTSRPSPTCLSCARRRRDVRRVGTAGSKGTKVFALSGKVSRTGLVEVAMGTTVRDIIFDIGGGIPTASSTRPCRSAAPPAAAFPSSTSTSRSTTTRSRSRRDDGLRRPGGDGRGHLHGRRRQVLHGLHPARELRQVHPLPRRHAPDARDPDRDHPRPARASGHDALERFQGRHRSSRSLPASSRTRASAASARRRPTRC
jgi:hypothetical protein